MPTTRLIEDIPRPTDEFGSHARVANAIADMIESEEGGKAVALEGSWGAGKSTVVELIRERMPDRVFVFDAWAHDRDPLRRVFLENLISFLGDRIDRDRWDKRVLELRGRRKVTESKVTPHLTAIGAIFGLFTLILPVGAALLAAGFTASKPDPALRAAGLIASLAPAALLVVVSIGSWLKFGWRRWYKRDNEAKFRFVGLFLNRATHDQTTESQEDPEPTSIEFAEVFSELLEEATQGTDEPLLLVVDNLDRVEREHALGVWSALRVFIEECNRGSRWSPKTWLLVPFDRPAMENLWVRSQLGGPHTHADQEHAEDDPSSSIDLQAHTVSESFLQKTFIVRFSVPPLLLADWREYLLRLLSMAFPEHDESEFHSVYRVVAIWRDDAGAPPTPRHLKLLANDMGALYRQWPDQFPLADIAYFTVLRTLGVDIVAGMLSQEIPGDRYASVTSDEVVEHFAALHFSRPIDQARHLLLEGPAKDALRRGEGDELQRLSSIRGFWPVFEDIAHRLAEEFSDATSAANAGMAIQSSGLAAEGPDQYRMAVREFCRSVSTDLRWEPLTAEVARGIAAHMEVLGEEAESQRLLHAAAETLASLGSSDGGEETVHDSTEAILILMESASGLDHHEATQEGVTLPTDVEALIQSCNYLGQERERSCQFWEKLDSGADPAETIERIAPTQGEPSWEEPLSRSFDVLFKSRFRARWGDFADKAIEALSVPDDSLPSGTVLSIVARLQHLARARTVDRKKMAEFVQTGFLHHHYHRAVQRDDREQAAGLFLSIAEAGNPSEQPGNVGESINGHQHIEQILSSPGGGDEVSAEIYESFRGQITANANLVFGHLLSAGQPALGFVQTLIADLAKERRLGRALGPKFALGRWRDFAETLESAPEVGFDVVVQTLVEERGFAALLCEKQFDTEDAPLALEIARASGLDDEQFRSWARSGLASLTKEVWIEALSESTELIDLLLEVKRVQTDFMLEDPMQDALLEFGKQAGVG